MTDAIRRTRNILVLEDEAFIAMMLQEELEALGIHVIGPVSNIKSATLLAETSDLDGALLDLNINGANAMIVADKLQARDIPFIFVTGYDLPAGLKYRDARVLHKPFTEIQLHMALIALLHG
jgi:CheY-like chemotaxis protein